MTTYKNNISKFITKMTLAIYIIALFFMSATVFAQIDGKNNNQNISNRIKHIPQNRLIDKDSIHNKRNEITKDSVQIDKDSLSETSSLKAKLTHYAEDYTEIDTKNKFIKLYNKAHVKYDDFELTAGVIYIDYGKKEVYAGRIPDSTGTLSQRPIFVQGSTKTENDSIRFNYETKKALVWNTYTKEGEISLLSEVTKKVNDSVMFVSNVKFTTSKDREHPEYYFLARKGKIVPKKKIVVGTTQMWIEEVPTPFVIPFGFFPLITTRASGFIVPNFSQSNRGFSLQNGGFYWAVNPYLDLTTTADFYTNGSYGVNIGSRYKKRYKYNGNLTYRYENNIQSIIGLPGYSKNTDWHLNWTHSQDAKSSPNSNFSAHVNFGSSTYYKNSSNYQVANNLNNRVTNSLNSSVTYTHNFSRLPMNYTLSLTHDQNLNSKTINLTLPNLTLNLNRIYPFSVDGKKKNAFQKINFTYKLTAANKISTTDSLLFTSRMWEGKKIGAKHTIPIQTDIKLLKYFNLNPRVNYTEVWALQTVEKSWDATANNGNGKEIVVEHSGFKSFRKVDISASLSTNIFGTYNFGDKHKIMGLRHTISPSLSYHYNPKFNQFIKEYEKSPGDVVEYTPFDQGQYGKPNLVEGKNIMLNLSQTFEVKYKSKDEKIKKLKLLTISNSYNFVKDSMQLSTFHLSSNFELTKGLNLNLTSNFDPYQIKDAVQTKEFAIKHGQGLGHFSNFTLSTGYKFDNNSFTKTKKKDRKKEVKKYVAYQNNIKWDISFTYNFTYKNADYIPENSTNKTISVNSLSFNGNIQITPNWKVGYRSGYDFVRKGILPSNFHFTRELKSWVMRFDWQPFGTYKSWYFYIGIKSSILKDIKYDKRKEPLQRYF